MKKLGEFEVMSVEEAEAAIAFYRDQMRRAKLGLPIFEPRETSAPEDELKTLRADTLALFQKVVGIQDFMAELAIDLTALNSKISRMEKRRSA